MPKEQTTKVCILGATGSVGFELSVHMLKAGCEIIAVVRNTDKLRRMLTVRGMGDLEELRVIELDLFAENMISDLTVTNEIIACDYIFNGASKPVSWMPWSRINRGWGAVVSSLTKKLVAIAQQRGLNPHIVAFCGPEYFAQYDDNISLAHKIMTTLTNKMNAALRDNHDEALLLLASEYQRWSVLRCGSIRPSSGQSGDASKIGADFHKDGSDYRRGKGKSLVVEDLAAYLANAIQSGEFSEFEGEMPFLFNTRF